MQYKFFLIIIFNFFITLVLNAKDIMVITVADAITPASQLYISNGIKEATEKNCQALIIKLDTPGGLLDATRQIVNNFFEAKIPIIVYVAPSGARAASAGVFITLAADIAVMANGTNIGAAHPVGLDGSSDTTVIGQKIVNDAAAFIRSIAEKRNRNVQWAEEAVKKSVSITETEALNNNIIDFICNDIDSVLKAIDGFQLEKNGKILKIDSKNTRLIYRDKNFKESILSVLSNPNLSYILILIGIWGIIFEFKSPGSIYPGAIGAISLLIASYSLQMLPINYVGLALIITAIILFILEIFIQSYALLTIGGIICFALGSLMLIDSPEGIVKISTELIIFATITTALLFGILIWFGIKAQKSKKAPIAEEMTSLSGVAISDFINGKGKVHVNGEIWIAFSTDDIKNNDEIVVEKVKGLQLVVRKKI